MFTIKSIFSQMNKEKFLVILDKTNEKFLFILDKEKFLFVLYKEQIQNKEKPFGNHLLFNGSLTIYYIVFGDNIFIFSKYFLTILSPETISLFFPTMTSWKFGYLGTLHQGYQVLLEKSCCRTPIFQQDHTFLSKFNFSPLNCRILVLKANFN